MASENRQERWPAICLILFVSGSLFLFFFQLLREIHPEWKTYQKRLQQEGFSHPRLGRIIDTFDNCTGQLDRCLTCHPGKDSTIVSQNDEKMTLWGPHNSRISRHFEHHSGCSACHGGQGRALSADVAHRQPLEKDDSPNPVYMQAACTRCHVAGSPGTEKVASGALLFFHLGCQMCHPLDESNLSGWDFGPRLDRPGLRLLSKLRQSVIDPAADFRQSTMPSFTDYFKGREPELESLLAFLLTLSQEPATCDGPRTRADFLATEACNLCHRDSEKPHGQPHRCLYLKKRASELQCQNCHQGALGGVRISSACVLESHRPQCRACHRGGQK